MRGYFMMVVGAAVLSALASIMTPEKWRKYIQLVTGIVILCCITSPIAAFLGSDGGFSIPEISSAADYDEDMHKDIVIEELRERIEEDIEERMKREYGAQIIAEVKIDINENNEIEGVTRIYIRGKLNEAAKQRLCEIYGVDMIYEK